MANRIVELRKARGISQRKLAGLVDTSFQQIYKLEKGINPLTQEWMERIAAALGVRPAALIDADAERLPDPEVESEFVDDPDELALLWLWRGVSDDMKTAALTILRNSMRRSGNAETI
jgi:transcriptional regulator with XRE-family HTH domain